MTTTLIARQPHSGHPSRPATGHIDDPVQDELLPHLAERGLRHYITQVAAEIGTGAEAAWCEWADAPSAYIPLDRGLPGHPDRDAALIWAAEQGWAVAAETGCGEDLLITASLGGDVLPAPRTVATFARAVLAGRHTRQRPSTTVPASASTDVARRLAEWASTGHLPAGK